MDTDGNGTLDQELTYAWTYDGLNRLVSESLDASDNALDYTTDFVYDAVGNRLAMAKDIDGDGVADQTTTYTYDANDRLLTETFDGVGTSNDRHTVYSYDVDGDGVNEATVQTGKAVHLGLNDQGTLESRTTYTFDERGRMAGVEIDSDGDGVVDSSISYAYNDDGIRVSMTADGVTTVYLIDANNATGYAQTLEEKDASGNVTKTFVIGQDVIAQAASDALAAGGINVPAGALLTLLYDGHGSTRALLDAAAAVIQSFAYDAYGTQLSGGAGLTGAATAFTTLLYSGEHFDAKTQMQYLRARWYDPGVGRFNRVDPFAGVSEKPQSLHRYLYVHANPVGNIDPTGKIAQVLAKLLAAIASSQALLYAAATAVFTLGFDYVTDVIASRGQDPRNHPLYNVQTNPTGVWIGPALGINTVSLVGGGQIGIGHLFALPQIGHNAAITYTGYNRGLGTPFHTTVGVHVVVAINAYSIADVDAAIASGPQISAKFGLAGPALGAIQSVFTKQYWQALGFLGRAGLNYTLGNAAQAPTDLLNAAQILTSLASVGAGTAPTLAIFDLASLPLTGAGAALYWNNAEADPQQVWGNGW